MTAPPDARQTLPTRPVRRLQRACACKGRDDCPTCRGRRAQRSAEGDTAPRQADMPRPASLEAGGRPLGAALRSQVEPLFGTSFHDVRVHDDAASHGHASALNAQAFTWGQHVHFGAGRYQPHTRYGLHLLAHELAHTIQQRGSVAQAAADSLDIDAPDSPAERAADAHADAVVADRATPVGVAPAGSGIARRLQRRWDRPRAGDCADVPEDRWIRKVVVEQETPQSVTLHWSDGTLETAGCSTGKGHCCVDTPDGVTCDRGRSRTTGSNCTPISSGAEFPISDRRREHNSWQFWNTFVPSRGIALHEYPVVDGTPLSHGCVRLPLDTARHIFCGERQNRTMVEVRGFARPRCDHAQLQQEWRDDISNSAIPGSDGEEYRTIVRDGYGHDLSEAERADLLSGTSSLPLPPRCPSGRTGAPPTDEERRTLPSGSTAARNVPDPVRPGRTATVPGTVAPTAAQQILEDSSLERLIPRFTSALAGAGSLAAARRVVRREGRNLWDTATARARRRSGADTDDRPLYWARLEMTRALRGFQPRWALAAADRDALVELFEATSRGRDTASFSGARRGAKRILVSGFDPFRLADRTRGNPSGAAVLALDGQTLTSGSARGRVEGTIFPVRFADFDAGRVESFFAPFLTGTNRVDMAMTISEGGGSDFEVEEFAARRRTNKPSHTDNLGVRGDLASPRAPLPASIGGAAASATIPVPGVAPGPEFLRTTLPPAVRGSLRSTPLPGETEITEVPRGGANAVRRTSGGPTAGSTAISGSGSNFLSNEIFYRTRLLRDTSGSTVPMGHLHTPTLDSPAISSATAFNAARDTIVARVRQILIDTLPSL
jgi:hypothetical protein